MKELQNYVDSIRDDLNKLYEADFTDEERERLEEEGEPTDVYTYFNDALDIEYIIGGCKDFRGVRIAVAIGGPNVYVDTRRGTIEGYWGSDEAEAWLPSEICDEINEMFEEIYECM